MNTDFKEEIENVNSGLLSLDKLETLQINLGLTFIKTLVDVDVAMTEI